MIIHTIQQGTDEWKQLRLGKFGSTDAQAIASNGKGLETLCFKKASEILSRSFEDGYTNEDIERGKEQETIARSSYEIETGNMVAEVGYVEISNFVGGSPDGLVGDDGIIEIKCQKPSVFVKTRFTKKIDAKYDWQIQHLLYITERKWCDFISFNENFSNLTIIRIDRNEEKIEKIKNGIKEGIKKVEEILEKTQ